MAESEYSTHASERILNSILDRVLSPLKSICALFTIVVMIIAVVDVFGRTLFHIPLPGSMELTELAMAVLVLPMFPYVMLKDQHMNVEMFYRKMSAGMQACVDVFSSCLCAIYLSLVSYELLADAVHKFAIKETTYVYEVPLGIFMGIAGLCMGLFALVVVLRMLTAFFVAQSTGKTTLAVIALCMGVAIALAPLFFSGVFMSAYKGTLGGLAFIYLFVLILLGIPIGLSMLIVGFQGLLLVMPTVSMAFTMVGVAPYSAVTAFHLSVIPMFLLMGELALIGGVSAALFNTASAWCGRLPGGLAIASVAGCAGFAAVCGESIPTAMTMASVALPEMRKHGYNPAFGAACLSLGGTLGILIPPSLGFIIYSIIVEESVGKLFMAGIIPGILLVVLISILIVIQAVRNPTLAPRGAYVPWAVKIRSLLGLIPMLLLFGAIIGGILTGLCSATEGGAIGSLAALLYAVFHTRVSFAQLRHSFEGATILASKIFLILVGVAVLGYFLAATRLPFLLADYIVEMGAGKWTVLLATIVLFIVLGCLMNVIPMISLVLPALYPTIAAFGFDPIWFGVICVLLMELGQITPPIGVLVFALASVAPDIPVESIFREIAPFFLTILLAIGLIIVFPGIATWLPNMLFSAV